MKELIIIPLDIKNIIIDYLKDLIHTEKKKKLLKELKQKHRMDITAHFSYSRFNNIFYSLDPEKLLHFSRYCKNCKIIDHFICLDDYKQKYKINYIESFNSDNENSVTSSEEIDSSSDTENIIN